MRLSRLPVESPSESPCPESAPTVTSADDAVRPDQAGAGRLHATIASDDADSDAWHYAWTSPRLRLLAGGIAMGCLSLLIVAAMIVPSPTGVGTHEALGRPACGFLLRTGVPCMSCGMTTSFSWFVRGNLIASVWVQPMGALLAGMSAVGVWAGAYVAITGRPIHRMAFRQFAKPRYAVGFIMLAIAAWGWKIFVHTHGSDGWQ